MPSTARPIVLFAGLLLLSVIIHVFLGWAWTITSGAAVGFLFGRHGWIYGALVVGGDWVVLLIYSYLVDARALRVMTETMGSIMGNMPSFAIVAITVLIGALLGLVGGAAGTQLRHLFAARRQEVRA